MRVFVAWEPILLSDWLRPKDDTLVGKIEDPRASHFWDPGKVLSHAILAAPWIRKHAAPTGFRGEVWDWIACYPRGARWDVVFPEPTLQRFPVEASDRDLEPWLASQGGNQP